MILLKLGSELPNLVKKTSTPSEDTTKCRLDIYKVECFNEVGCKGDSFSIMSLTSFHMKNGVQFLQKLNIAKTKHKQKKTSYSFLTRLLTFKLPQEFLKYNDIYAISTSPKADIEANFLKSENRRFKNLRFSQKEQDTFNPILDVVFSASFNPFTTLM